MATEKPPSGEDGNKDHPLNNVPKTDPAASEWQDPPGTQEVDENEIVASVPSMEGPANDSLNISELDRVPAQYRLADLEPLMDLYKAEQFTEATRPGNVMMEEFLPGTPIFAPAIPLKDVLDDLFERDRCCLIASFSKLLHEPTGAVQLITKFCMQESIRLVAMATVEREYWEYTFSEAERAQYIRIVRPTGPLAEELGIKNWDRKETPQLKDGLFLIYKQHDIYCFGGKWVANENKGLEEGLEQLEHSLRILRLTERI